MRRVARAAGLAGLLLAQCPSAFALNTAFDVSQYAHTSWKIRDGFAKGTIVAIAQTPDGYIWLGTDVGLLRFDGVRTVPWQPPSGQHLPSDQIFTLTVTRDGTLWIGTSKGLARWKTGKFTHQVEMAGRYVGRVLEDREGSVWIARESRVPPEWQLCEMRDSRVRCLGDDGGPGVGASGLYEDSRSNLWVGTLSGLWRWKPGPSEFYPLSMPNGIQGLAEDNDGTLLVSHIGGLKRFVDGKAEMTYSFPPATQSLQFPRLLRDRDGGLWAGSALGGAVVHVHRGITDVFGQADGLSGSVVNALFEDREGSVWVATSEGLDRFRDTSAATLSVGQGLSNAYISSVLATQDGSVWAGTSEGLNRWTDGHVTVYRERNPLTREETGRRASRMVREVTDSGIPAGGVASIFEDSLGRVWVSTIHRGLGYIQNDRFTPLAGVPGGITRAIVEDKAGILWIADQDSGLFRVSPHTTEVRKIPWATLSDQGTPSAVVADRKDSSTWMGFRRGGVAHLFGDKIRELYSVSNGMPSGKIQHLWLDADDTLWAATDGGLSRIRNGRVATLTSANGLPCDGVEWGVEDDDHAFWLATPCGVVRISHGELYTWALAIDEHRPLNRVLQTTIFDSSDGVRTYIGANYYTAPAVRSRDGRLWYMSPDGLGVIDPRHLPLNNLPPPVHIERITANRKAYDGSPTANGLVSLPALVRDLEIDYTALSLVAPEKNRFRYKLEGFDRDWQDVGNRRQAYYTNLPPRSYRFRVIASNNSGVWNETGTSLDFSIAPAYYQTTWFAIVSILATLALIGALYRWRVRQVAYAYESRLQERVNERTRIARDLHDTLLQSFHGLLFRFQAATNTLPDQSATRKMLESAIDQAAQAITEGRDAVQNLRASTTVTNDLAEALSTLGNELAAAQSHDANVTPTSIDVAVEGATQDLHPIVRDDVYRIAGEALRNAFRHAGAGHIEVTIRYDERQLQVRVRDDGKGIDAAVREQDRPGHFGLAGMRERAELIGGRLDVWSARALGTEVELTIPATAAYATPRVRDRFRLFTKTGVMLALAMLASSTSALALNPALDVSQYAHTAWKIREGFVKGPITAIAQTADGYLWLGTEFGLVRFDGVRAVPWQPPSNQSLPSEYILDLLAAHDGTLWIATDKGLASWNAGALTGYAELTGNYVGPLAEDREGAIWAGVYPGGRLCAIRKTRVECSRVVEGQTNVNGLFVDKSGALWAGVRNGLWRWRPGPPTFVRQDENQNGIRGMVDGDGGSLLVSTRGQLVEIRDGQTRVALKFPEHEQRFQTMRMLRDRDGGVWVATSGGGVVHVHEGRTDVLTRADGLSNDAVRAMYEDRERNIWVSTDGGLDRFHETAVSTLSTKQGLSNDRVISVLAGRDGTVWIGTFEGLNRWKDGQLTVYRNERVPAPTGADRPDNVREVVGRGLPEHGVHSIFEDSRGRVWIPTGSAFGYLNGERFVPVDMGRAIDRVNSYSIAEDSHGAIWIATLELGLVRVDPVGGVREIPVASLNRTGDVLSTLLSDPAGDGVWVGFQNSGLAYLADGRIRKAYATSDGLAGGRITGLYRDARGTLWIAAEQGLSRLKNGRLTTFTSRNGLPCDGIHWVIEDGAHALWMDTPCGLVRIALAELDEASPIHAAVFATSDGVPIVTGIGGYSPHVTRSLDGRLWFAGNDGVNVVDPQHLSTNPLPPPVHVERVVADRTTYTPAPVGAGEIRLPPLGRDLEIDYTALSFVAPEKVHFRYLLEGFDRDWQDVGNRRQAYYNSLSPGSYRFRVVASNASGVWNEAGAAIEFSIAPAYYQTAWFRSMAVAVVLGLIWALYQYRLGQLAHEFDLRLQERVNERTRIARDLHDTLLQSFHGLLFRFQAVTNMLPARPVEAKQSLESAIDQAAAALTEGRDAVQNLRASTTVTNDLAEAIHTLGQDLAAAQVQDAAATPTVAVVVEGASRDLHPILRDDIYRIAGEALRNALRHARARAIDVTIQYGERQLQVTVRDDGKGIDMAACESRPAGHFGLSGMRERAELIGGRLDVWSEAGKGTEVNLTIPAVAAYGMPRARTRLRWFLTRLSTNS